MESTGELQKYWKQFEEADDRARDEAKKIERERRKLELGSDYESDAEDDEEVEDEDEESGQQEGSQILSVSCGSTTWFASRMRRPPISLCT